MTEDSVISVGLADGSSDAEPLDALAGQWPGWRVWRSRGRELVCATRRVPLPQPARGLSETIIANTVAELADALHSEAMRESQAWS